MAGDVTSILSAVTRGEPGAADRLWALVHPLLHDLASRQLDRERIDHTLQTTALVDDAFMRLIGQSRAEWTDRAQFLGIAAKIMRRILLDHAKTRNRLKRGGGIQPQCIDDAQPAARESSIDMIALNEAMTELEAIDPLKARMVEMRYFGGATIDEVAQVLGVSTRTVERGWEFARRWLYDRIFSDDGTCGNGCGCTKS